MLVLHWFGDAANTLFAIGYAGVFIGLIVEGLGLPFPGEGVMAFYGFAAAQGRFHWSLVTLFCILGYLVGTSSAYVFSRVYGSRFTTRLFQLSVMSSRGYDRTTRLMHRYGALLLIPGRFLPGVRSLSSYVAGATAMQMSRFVVFTAASALVWCSCWVSIGYWFGENMSEIIKMIQSSLLWLTAIMVFIVTIGVLFRRHFAR